MGKCEAGSVALERPLKLWSLILDNVRCGGGGFQRKKSGNRKGSEKLSELLKQPEWWEGMRIIRRHREARLRLLLRAPIHPRRGAPGNRRAMAAAQRREVRLQRAAEDLEEIEWGFHGVLHQGGVDEEAGELRGGAVQL
ncbi:hypothetical protein SASPL_126908 [Salvia splendens]|uniref:Uncharacterized protein n=1 Tax=Salvia splendens TaxID=180675 RepID=A0A8X8XI16_SALSN|nr:hypothetical protein SASPL_126908 [Salvia splendens]